MKKLAVIISSMLLSTAATAADSYQSISHLGYKDTDGNDTVSVDSTYYFAPKKTMGPYDQFEYINRTTNVFGSYADDDFGDVTNIGGEYFVQDFVIGAGYSNYDYGSDTDLFNVSAGYFFNPNLLLKATFTDVEDGDNYVMFDLKYNHQINSTDYLGFTFTADDEFDYRAVSAKYFMDLQQGNYLTIEGTAEYGLAVQKLLFGADAEIVVEKRAKTAQAPGGQGPVHRFRRRRQAGRRRR